MMVLAAIVVVGGACSLSGTAASGRSGRIFSSGAGGCFRSIGCARGVFGIERTLRILCSSVRKQICSSYCYRSRPCR